MTQTIRRAARRHRFVIVDQAAVEDTRLSWAARGLLAYLLSRPDDWRVLANDLKKRGNLGRDGIYGLLRELRRAGYLRFERNRDAQGRMRGGTYIVSEVPRTASSDMGRPDAAAPRPVNAGALPSTERTNRTTTTTRPTDTYPATDAGVRGQRLRFPEWVPDEMLAPATRLAAGLPHAEAQLSGRAHWRPARSSARLPEDAGGTVPGRRHEPALCGSRVAVVVVAGNGIITV
jgi:hypothetical protein